MAQAIFIKVVGFTDEERHALNTIFRLSEDGQRVYHLWTDDRPDPAELMLLDGSSYEARVEAESPRNAGVRFGWVGDEPPEAVWRAFERPIHWPVVLEAMDGLFGSPAADLDLDFDLDHDQDHDDTGPATQPPESSPPPKRALIVASRIEDRLYMRARLALAGLTQADEACSGAEAMDLVRGRQYDVALADCTLPDMDGLELLRQIRDSRSPIPHVVLSKAGRTVFEQMRARWAGARALLNKPPHPGRLQMLLERV